MSALHRAGTKQIALVALAMRRLDQSRAHYRAEARLLAWVNRSPERRESIRALVALAALLAWALVALVVVG